MSKRYKCVQCGYPVIDDNDLANGVELTNNCATHWRVCVSQRYWPSYMRLGKPLDKPLDKTKKKVLDKPETVMFTDKSSTEGVAPRGSSVLPEEGSTGTPSLSVEL